jgi:hypothetical protein
VLPGDFGGTAGMQYEGQEVPQPDVHTDTHA